jgi:glycosyltransferase involved in cell wall biosynthesis
MPGSVSAESLVQKANFTPIYADWLRRRDLELVERLRSVRLERDTRVLLLNATLGLQLYPSITDFFALLQRAQPRLRTTSVSYFDEIHELAPKVAAKGLPVMSVAELFKLEQSELSRFDVVLAIGPSEALFGLMSQPSLRSKLVLLDLGFYHQLLDYTERAFLTPGYVDERRLLRRQNLVCYSCQPAKKVKGELSSFMDLSRLSFAWFNYIPIGFRYADYFRSDRQLFDVALLGTSGRDYAQLDSQALRGLRFVFLGNAEQAPELARLGSELDITRVSRADEQTYGKVLALCRSVLLPLTDPGDNVQLSVVDALASGVPLVVGQKPGLERLAQEQAPVVLCRDSRALNSSLTSLLSDEPARRKLGQDAISFAKERMDIYGILETILRQQVL